MKICVLWILLKNRGYLCFQIWILDITSWKLNIRILCNKRLLPDQNIGIMKFEYWIILLGQKMGNIDFLKFEYWNIRPPLQRSSNLGFSRALKGGVWDPYLLISAYPNFKQGVIPLPKFFSLLSHYPKFLFQGPFSEQNVIKHDKITVKHWLLWNAPIIARSNSRVPEI